MEKKKELTIKINFSNRLLYTFIVLGILVLVAVGVYAYGTSNPSTFGHSTGEIDFSGGFTIPSGDINLGDSGKIIIGTTTITSINRTTITAQGFCIGTDCKTSWAPSPIATGLYGICRRWSSGCGDAREPAYCSGDTCACRSGYTMVNTGGSNTGSYYFSCYKN